MPQLPFSLPAKHRFIVLLLGVLSVLFITTFTLSPSSSSTASGSSYFPSLSLPFGSSTSSLEEVQEYTPSIERPITYLPYTFGYAMLEQTLEGYRRAGWRDLVIVDNSWDHHAHSQLPHLRTVYPSSFLLTIIPTPVHLRFSQLQGFIDHLAENSHLFLQLSDVKMRLGVPALGMDTVMTRRDMESGKHLVRSAPAYFWSHTDIIILPNNTDPTMTKSPYTRAVECLVKGYSTRSKPGVLFFAYDWLSGVYTEAARKAPWDPAMPQYGADCDRYQRIRRAGYDVWDCEEGIGKIMHLHSVLSPDDRETLYETGMNLTEQILFVETVVAKESQYAWRELSKFDAISEMDRKAAEAEDKGGKMYFESKWGWPFDCEIANRNPAWDLQWEEEEVEIGTTEEANDVMGLEGEEYARGRR